MRKRIGRIIAAAAVTGLTVATLVDCNADQCSTNAECPGGGDCVSASCELGKCVLGNAPAGTIPSEPGIAAGACEKVVCDGAGHDKLEPDPSNVPPGPGPACRRNTCDANGHETTEPDPSKVPEGPGPACKRYGCDDDGHETTTPDPTNLPPASSTTGTCTKGGCDADGNETTVPDPKNPPPPDECNTYTCDGSTVVPTPTVGKICSPLGLSCDSDGACAVCPPTDATCTDPGPGGSAHSLGTAYSFGAIGLCDGDGSTLCGAEKGGEDTWFSYTSCGSLSLCDFDPFVSVEATGMVKLCEYFATFPVTCPSGSSASSDTNGDQGCCITTTNGSMAIVPTEDDSGVFIEVENTTSACVGYELTFHS